MEAPPMTTDTIVGRLKGMRRIGGGWIALCPAHDDHDPSLSITVGEDGRTLLHCHAGCSAESIVGALGIQLADLFGNGQRPGGNVRPSENGATVQPPGCTLAEYAAQKQLPVSFLQRLGLADATHAGSPVLWIPYRDAKGDEVAVRLRAALAGPQRFRWRKGDKPCLYGLWRLGQARTAGYVILVEGESDVHTLLHQ